MTPGLYSPCKFSRAMKYQNGSAPHLLLQGSFSPKLDQVFTHDDSGALEPNTEWWLLLYTWIFFIFQIFLPISFEKKCNFFNIVVDKKITNQIIFIIWKVSFSHQSEICRS